MPLRQSLELALLHAAQNEQRIAELHHKRQALEHEGMYDRAATAGDEIERLQHGLEEIERYVRIVRQRISEVEGSAS